MIAAFAAKVEEDIPGQARAPAKPVVEVDAGPGSVECHVSLDGVVEGGGLEQKGVLRTTRKRRARNHQPSITHQQD